jgi:hypothetical protein
MHRSSCCGFGFLCLFGIHVFSTQIRDDFTELFEGGFEVFDDFLGQNVGIGEIVGLFELSSLRQETARCASVAVESPILPDEKDS